jgi:hypothetical protein
LRLLRMPPRIKVLEAAGALGDGRVLIRSRDERGVLAGNVKSSDGSRVYSVFIKNINNKIIVYSDDNGTKLRGYIGYPIIAVMMLSGILPRDEYAEKSLAGIPWRQFNEKYKKYSLVEEVIKTKLKPGVDWDRIEEFRRRILERLRSMRVYYSQGLAPP